MRIGVYNLFFFIYFVFDNKFHIFIIYSCRQGKKLLMASLACWVLFTIPLSFIKPEAVNCIERKNETDFVLTLTRTKRDLSAYDMSDMNKEDVESYHSQAALQDALTMPQSEAMEESHRR